MILNKRHTGLVVRNLTKEIEFYEALGLSVSKRRTEEGEYIEKLVGIPNVILDWAKLEAPDGSILELIKYERGEDKSSIELRSANTLGCSHVAYGVTDIEATCRNIIDQGGMVIGIPQLTDDGSVKVVYCYDPEGILIELVEELG